MSTTPKRPSVHDHLLSKLDFEQVARELKNLRPSNHPEKVSFNNCYFFLPKPSMKDHMKVEDNMELISEKKNRLKEEKQKYFSAVAEDEQLQGATASFNLLLHYFTETKATKQTEELYTKLESISHGHEGTNASKSAHSLLLGVIIFRMALKEFPTNTLELIQQYLSKADSLEYLVHATLFWCSRLFALGKMESPIFRIAETVKSYDGITLALLDRLECTLCYWKLQQENLGYEKLQELFGVMRTIGIGFGTCCHAIHRIHIRLSRFPNDNSQERLEEAINQLLPFACSHTPFYMGMVYTELVTLHKVTHLKQETYFGYMLQSFSKLDQPLSHFLQGVACYRYYTSNSNVDPMMLKKAVDLICAQDLEEVKKLWLMCDNALGEWWNEQLELAVRALVVANKVSQAPEALQKAVANWLTTQKICTIAPTYTDESVESIDQDRLQSLQADDNDDSL